MRIDQYGIAGAGNNLYGVGESGGTASSGSTQTLGGSALDQARSGKISDLVAMAMNSGGTDRIAQLREMVQAGTYNIDTQALSRQMVQATMDGY